MRSKKISMQSTNVVHTDQAWFSTDGEEQIARELLAALMRDIRTGRAMCLADPCGEFHKGLVKWRREKKNSSGK